VRSGKKEGMYQVVRCYKIIKFFAAINCQAMPGHGMRRPCTAMVQLQREGMLLTHLAAPDAGRLFSKNIPKKSGEWRDEDSAIQTMTVLKQAPIVELTQEF
jgi:hypothetical protein